MCCVRFDPIWGVFFPAEQRRVAQMLKPMAWTFIFALLGALLIALTLSPVLGYYVLPRKPKGRVGFFEGLVTGTYGFLLAGAMKSRWVSSRWWSACWH